MFKILHECGLARTGRISTIRGSITTPALLLSVRNGDLHGLTPDAYNHFLYKTGILVNPLDYIGVKWTHQATAAEALNFPQAPFVLCFPRDPVQTEYLPSNNDKGIVVLLRPGQRQISPSVYTDLVKRLSPDAFVALWDQIPPDANEKRAMTGIYRNTKWLEKVLHATEEDSLQIWATISNGKSEFLNKLASEKVSVLNPQGYILDKFANKAEPAISIEDLKHTMSCLDNKTLKMLPGKMSPSEMLQGIQQGVDVFDSSLIWDLSLKGHALIWMTPSVDNAIQSYTILDLNKDSHKMDGRPLMESCGCYTCRRHCRGYIHHLLREKEIIGEVLLQMHNVHWMLGFFQTIRDSINADRLLQVQFIPQEN